MAKNFFMSTCNQKILVVYYPELLNKPYELTMGIFYNDCN